MFYSASFPKYAERQDHNILNEGLLHMHVVFLKSRCHLEQQTSNFGIWIQNSQNVAFERQSALHTHWIMCNSVQKFNDSYQRRQAFIDLLTLHVYKHLFVKYSISSTTICLDSVKHFSECYNERVLRYHCCCKERKCLSNKKLYNAILYAVKHVAWTFDFFLDKFLSHHILYKAYDTFK